jgi:hypothetical protein
VSKKVQQRAVERRDAAKKREQNARERAERKRERGKDRLVQLHKLAADAQRGAAEAAEDVRAADASVEGDQLATEDKAPPAGGLVTSRSYRRPARRGYEPSAPIPKRPAPLRHKERQAPTSQRAS